MSPASATIIVCDITLEYLSEYSRSITTDNDDENQTVQYIDQIDIDVCKGYRLRKYTVPRLYSSYYTCSAWKTGFPKKGSLNYVFSKLSFFIILNGIYNYMLMFRIFWICTYKPSKSLFPSFQKFIKFVK